MAEIASHSSWLQRVRAYLHFWSARVHRHYGIVYADKQEFQSAVEAYARASNLHPLLERAYLERGILLWRELGRSTHAIRDLSAALSLHPNWPDALFNRALAYHAAGNFAAAMEDLNAYLALDDETWRDDAASQLAQIRDLAAAPASTESLL